MCNILQYFLCGIVVCVILSCDRNALVNTDLKLGLTEIGCGLAGGNWHIVKAIIEDVFQDSDVEVTIYEY